MRNELAKKIIGGTLVYMAGKAVYNLGKIKGSLETSNEYHGKIGKCKLHVTVQKENIEETQV
ncbi:MAG: hypothetical protein J6B01_04450 [Ruminococcus sp.]|nr:hypothetical protein [Ruminococcus sp.]